jgi:thioredoxin reductase (NADPH)
MSKPVILVVDDDPAVLNAIDRDLRQRYQRTYKVVKAPSGADALDAVTQLKKRGTPIALFIVDQRMPNMSGTEFLTEAKVLYPTALKVLLTAYAETQTAITAINEIGLDHYLLKPWEPPEDRLYPVLDELLADWVGRNPPAFDGIRVAGTSLSAASYGVRDFLSRNYVPYQWVDLDTDQPTRAGLSRLPVVLFPDGTMVAQPTLRELAAKIGLSTTAQQPFYDVVIIGGGPAGLASAVYAASEGLRVVLVERESTGGQAGTSSYIENYLGFPTGITGADLARRARAQAERFKAEIVSAQEVVSVARNDPYRVVTLADGSTLKCYAVVIATGMEVRRLEAEGVDDLVGAGVYYGAALSEAATYRGCPVTIVGAGNSAGQGALFFAKYAATVTILLRSSALTSMSQYLVERIGETRNIEVQPNTVVKSVRGDRRLEAITLLDTRTQATREMAAAAMFVFIGSAPRTAMLGDLVVRDAGGFVITGRDLLTDGKWPASWTVERDPFLFETSVPGIFAVGDARRGSSKRVAAAVGEGSATIGMVHEYLRTV